MKKLTFRCFVAGTFLCLAASADQMKGYISDAHCGAKHDKVSAANTQCVDKCLKGGADPVLVVDDKVIKMDDESKKKAMEFAGQNVSVDGTMQGDMLKVNSISAAAQ